jgi:hypothetical protein
MNGLLDDRRFQSLASEGSSVEPVSNLMTLGDLQKQDLINWFLNRQLPFELLGVFLHELTHHWCFHSIVGTSLTLLRLQIEEAIVSQRCATEIGFAVLTRNAVRFDAAIAVLRPLAEGLALFAEHNAELGESPALSLPSHWGLQLFLDRGQPIKSAQVIDYFKMFCWEYRVSALAIGRKGNLLTQPLRTNVGGYLPGYLTVRNLYRMALARTNRFRDTDLFLNYLRDLVFGDSQLAFLLQDSSLGGMDAVNAIAEQLAGRFSLLNSADLDERVKSFEEIASKGDLRHPEAGVPPHEWSIFNSANKTESALDLLRVKMRDLTAFRDYHQSSEWELRITAYATLLQRGLVRLGYIDVRVVVNEHGRVVAYDGENPIIAGNALSQAQLGEGPGQLVFYLIQDVGVPMLLCLRDGKLVAHFESPGSNMSKDKVSAIVSAATFGLIRYEASKVLETMLQSLLNQNDEFQEAMAHAEEITEGVYWHKALLFVIPDQKREEAYLAMEETGFLGLLGDDEELVYALAALSLAAAGHARPDHLETVFSKLNVNFELCLTKLKEVQTACGFPLFELIDLPPGPGGPALQFLHSFV